MHIIHDPWTAVGIPRDILGDESCGLMSAYGVQNRNAANNLTRETLRKCFAKRKQQMFARPLVADHH